MRPLSKPNVAWMLLAGLVLVVVSPAAAREWTDDSQNEAVAEIEKLGGQVTFDGDSPDKQVVKVVLDDVEDANAALEHVRKLTGLKELNLFGNTLTDAGLVHLKGLTSLQELWLDGTQVTDAGLMHLKRLTSLEGLHLENTQVTDAGVHDLQKALPNCRILR